MSRASLYYVDWKEKKTGWRYRAVMTPAHNTTISRAGAPLFGAGSTGVYVKLPARAWLPIRDGEEGGHDKIPIGSPELAPFAIGLDLQNIDATVRGYLLNPTWDGGLALLGGHQPLVLNSWLITTDRGDRDRAIGDFHVAFQGVQRRTPATKFHIDRKKKTATMEISLTHIALAAAELVRPYDLWLYLADSGTLPSYTRSAWQTVVVDLAWRNAAETRDYARLQFDRRLDSYQEAELWKLDELYYAMSAMLESAVKSLTRVSTSLVSFRSHTARTVNGRSVGGPTDLWTFTRQGHADDGGHGTAIAAADLTFIGRVRLYTPFTLEESIVGGFLIDDGSGEDQASMFRYKTLWDLLKEMTEGCAAKLVSPMVGPDVVRYLFHPPLGVIGPGSVPIPLAAGEYVGSRSDPEQGGSIIGSCDTQAPEGDGYDADDIGVPAFGHANEQGYTLGALWHNLPQSGKGVETGDFSYLLGNGPLPLGVGSSNGTYVYTPGFRTMGLYYASDVAFWDGAADCYLLASHYVSYNRGDVTLAQCEDSFDLPTPDSGDLDTADKVRDNFWKPYCATVSGHQGIQHRACLPFAAASAVASTFSGPMQTVYPETVRLSSVDRHDIGQMIDEDSFANGSARAWDGTDLLDALPGSPVILRVNENHPAGTATVTLLAPDL
jgi:hypothetical protein